MKNTKWKHPEKHTMNLVQDRRAPIRKRNLLIAGGILIVAVVFVKIGIVDEIARVKAAEQAYLDLENDVLLSEKMTEEYDDLYAQYRRFDDSLLEYEEPVIADRIEIMDMVDRCARGKAEVSALTISQGIVNATVVNSSLQDISLIVERLRTEEMVSHVTVQTAASDSETGKATGFITITLKLGEEMYVEESE